MREHLSNREKQPGHDLSYRQSENVVYQVAEKIVGLCNENLLTNYPHKISFVKKPQIDCGNHKIQPDFGLSFNGKWLFFEVKKQGNGGNAQERLCKYLTQNINRHLRKISKVKRPIKFVLCEGLGGKLKNKTSFFFNKTQLLNDVLFQETLEPKEIEKFLFGCVFDELLQGG